MELRSNLSEEEKEELKSKKWYNQRFDGCPFIFAYICAAHARREARKENGECTMLAFFFESKTDYYIDQKDNERITRYFLEQSKNNQAFTKEFMSRWTADELAFDREFNKLDSIDLTKLSNKDLVGLVDEFGESYVRRVTSSSVIDGFALGSDHIVADKIHTHLQNIGRDSEYNSLFSALTAPAHLSFTNEAEFELLKIASEVSKNPELKNLFLEHDEQGVVTKLKEHGKLYGKLVNHQKNFYWLHNNYVDGHILPVEFFVSEIAKMLREGIDIEHELKFIRNHPLENKERKERLIRELKLPSDLVALIYYSEDFTKWQDERKKATFFATHYFTVLLDEIKRRTDFSLMELKYLLPYELKAFFEGKIKNEDLQKRISDGCMSVIAPEYVTFIVGEEAMKLYDEIKRLDVPKDLKLIKGLPASLGKVVGTAKIVKSSKEIGKVKEGDILLAVMTRPDYVIGMRKAAAIVTDEGGLTCHAAIVSRELRIPCVIATKFASHVIFDGDKVEVNADKGEVRILERAKPTS